MPDEPQSQTPVPAATPDPAPAAAPAATPDPAPAAAPAAPVVPDSYAAFTLPEGIKLEGKLSEIFSAVAKEAGMTQEGAQLWLTKFAPVLVAQSAAGIENFKANLLEAAKADKEIGGDKLQGAISTAQLALKEYFSPEFKAELDASGFGNHPLMIKGLAKIGALLKQDTMIPGGGTPPADLTPTSFYGASKMNP